jgi:molecular chaperone GrpE (heat shock protein)
MSNGSSGSAPVKEMEAYIGNQLTVVHELKKQVAAKEQEKQDQLREFLLGLIELLDAMEQKEQNLRERYEDNADALKIINNHASLQKRLWRQLERYGVSRIDFKAGKLLVGLSKVVDTMPDPAKPNESIISIVSHGYMRGNTVLREAELIVVKN